MVEITERVLLSYKDAKEVAIPRNLLHVADGGERYLKIQGSHMAVCKLAAGGHLEVYKQCKNPSLSSSANYGLLKEKLANAAQESCNKEQEEGEKDIFEGSTTGTNQKKRKATLEACSDTVEIAVKTCQVKVLRPMSYKQQDLWVLLDPQMLEAVFCFLGEDVETCFKNDSKRSYSKKTS